MPAVMALPAPLAVEGEERQDRVVPVPGRTTPTVQPAIAAVLPTREATTRQEQRIPTTAVMPTTALAAGVSGPRHGHDGVPAMPTVTTVVAALEPTTRAARRRTPMTATTNSGHLRPPSMDSARPTAEKPPRNRRPALFAVLALAPAHRADGLHDSAEPLDRALPGGQLPTVTTTSPGILHGRKRGPHSRGRYERIPPATMSPGLLLGVQGGEQEAHDRNPLYL